MKRRRRHDYRREIVAMLERRAAGATICPSEVLAGDDRQNADLMQEVRRSARLLAAEGTIEIVQRGKPVDPQSIKGPIRLRLCRLTDRLRDRDG